MILLTIILSTTDIARLWSENISLFRISLIISTILAIIYIILKGEVKKGRYLYFIILILISSPVSYFLSTNKEWALSFMLNDFMGIILIFLIVNFFSKNDINLLLKTFIYSQFITIIFTIYSFYLYYILGSIPQNINLFGIFNIQLSEQFLDRTTISTNLRATLPYATPPHLSIVMAAVLGLLFYKKDLFAKKTQVILIMLFLMILIMTSSRTGIVALVLAAILVIAFKLRHRFSINKFILSSISIVSIVMIVVITDIDFFDKLLSRFFIEDIFSNRHFLVPVEGIIIWISSFSTFLLGIGSGSSAGRIGEFTFLPPHFLNSYVTLITERGILGLLIVIELLRLSFRSLSNLIRPEIKSKQAISISILIILLSFLFYEARQVISIWILVAIIFIFEMIGERRVTKN